MEYTRLLRRYKSGDDVLAVKKKLLELGYLSACTHNIYGNDTYKAVKAFQSANNLEVDGIVGSLTWAALFSSEQGGKKPVSVVDVPDHIGSEARSAIGAALASVSTFRREICLDALQEAIDPHNNPSLMRSFYIRGGNLYNTDLYINTMTKEKLTKYFNTAAYKPYFSNGRQEVIEKQAEAAGYTQTGADCSGGVVGIWRKHKVQSKSFDATANGLYGSYCVKTTNPQPGDLAWSNGHIGIVVGGGYVVEWAGGAYGCQLTKIKDRRLYNFVTKKLGKFGSWTAFGDPKKY